MIKNKRKRKLVTTYTDEFIQELVDPSIVYNDTIRNRDIVWFKCLKDPSHPNYLQRVRSHLDGAGCHKCAANIRTYKNILVKKPKTYTTEFIKELVDPSIVLGTGLKTTEKVWFKCLKDSTHPNYIQIVRNHLSGKGCPICGRLKNDSNRSKAARKLNPFSDKFINDIAFPNDIVLDNLRNKDKLYFRCHKGHPNYLQSVKKHRMGQGCPICRDRTVPVILSKKTTKQPKSKPNKVYPDWFTGSLVDKNIDILTIKYYDKLMFKCLNNKEHPNYEQLVKKRLKTKDCPKCIRQNSTDRKLEKLRIKNPFPQWFIDDLVIIPENVSLLKQEDKILFKCSKKLHPDYIQSVHNHLYGSGCPQCAGHQSKAENEIKLFIESFGLEVKQRTKELIPPLEIDLYVPHHNIAIEYNGLFWHSDRYRDKDYHVIKYNLCKDKGVQLITIWEDDWTNKKEVVKNMILSKLNLLKRIPIHGRKTTIKTVSPQDAKTFLNNNHIQGYVGGLHYGLFFNDMLVSIMSIKKVAKNTVDRGSYLLNRYASDSRYFVIGGLEKLMKYAERELLIKRWVSFADLDVSNGSLYIKDGWKEEKIIPPDYKYIYRGKREHKFNFRLKRFRTDSNLKYEENMTEKKLAELNKILRVYDSGKIKYVKIVSQ